MNSKQTSKRHARRFSMEHFEGNSSSYIIIRGMSSSENVSNATEKCSFSLKQFFFLSIYENCIYRVRFICKIIFIFQV